MDQVLVADASGRFAVDLEEPAAAGYSWMVVDLPPGIQLEGDEVTPADGGASGGVRHHVFRFAATQQGRQQLDFELRRSWEVQATDTRHVQVQVGA